MLIIFIVMWIIAGILAYFLERAMDYENGEPMSFVAALLMGVIGFMMVTAEFSRNRHN